MADGWFKIFYLVDEVVKTTGLGKEEACLMFGVCVSLALVVNDICRLKVNNECHRNGLISRDDTQRICKQIILSTAANTLVLSHIGLGLMPIEHKK